jgi:transposase
MQVTTIGLDIAKSVFQVHGVDERGRAVLRKRLARAKVLEFFAKLPPCVIGLEACGGAHHWARELQALGHDARLIPPQYVKAYVKTNKHDMADAEACAEAVRRPSMRFVPVKSAAQQAMAMRHRVRDQLVGQRTATINALRGHLAEFGLVAAQRRQGLGELLAVLGDLEDRRVPPLAREVLASLTGQLRDLEARIAALDRRLVQMTRADPVCRALAEVPGIGPVIATAFTAAVPDPGRFASGRHLSAWLGLVRHRWQAAATRPEQTRRRLPPSPADPRCPGGGPGQPRSERRVVVVGRRAAGAPAVQRRGGGGGEQAGADRLGDAEPGRGLPSGRVRRRPATIAQEDLHELRGRGERDGMIGRTEAGTPRVGPGAFELVRMTGAGSRISSRPAA